MKPVIGIVVAASRHKDKVMTVESKYMLALEKSGAIPVLFPIYRKGLIPREKLLSIIDGVLLTGSYILRDKKVKKSMVKKHTTLREVNPIYNEYCTK